MDDVTDQRRRVLIVAYYFPPLGGIGSLRVTRFAEHLPAYGWEPTILAPREGAFHRDPHLAFPEERVVRTRSIELSRAGKRLVRAGGDDVRATGVGGARGLLRAAVRGTVYYPDAQVGWYPAAVRAGRRLLRSQRFDAIYSSSVPVTAHLIARRLQRDSGLPWVAEFRDPWSAGFSPGLRRRRALRLERSLTADAAAVVMTSPTWAAQFSELWGRPVTTITNGHDGIPPVAPPATGETVLAYLGSYYPGLQDLAPVWAALRLLRERGANAPDRVCFIGQPGAAVLDELRHEGLEDLAEVTGFLAHDEALRRLAGASILVLAGSRDVAGIGRGVIPGKVFDYLATALPIVYVGASGSDVAALLRPLPGCFICGTGDPAEIADALVAARGTRHERDVKRFSRRTLTGELAGLLDAVQVRA